MTRTHQHAKEELPIVDAAVELTVERALKNRLADSRVDRLPSDLTLGGARFNPERPQLLRHAGPLSR